MIFGHEVTFHLFSPFFLGHGVKPTSQPLVLEEERCHAIAVVAGDAVSSLETPEFLRRADQGCQDGLGAAWGCIKMEDFAPKM